MFEKFLQKIFIKNRMAFEFSFYETVMLSIELSIQQMTKQRSSELISEKAENLL